MISILNDSDISRIPNLNKDIVYKDECIYCFRTPEHKCGLYICLKTFVGVCRCHLELLYKKTTNRLYLHLQIEKRIKEDNVTENTANEYQKLLNDAFHVNKCDIIEHQSLVLLPEFEEIKLPTQLPENLSRCLNNILSADSLSKIAERAAQNENFDAKSMIKESKYSLNLVQLKNGVKIPPNGLKCSKCDLTKNLWINLTDGTLLCGRKFFDGSGGNNHAIEHYELTKYPLAVKLGTITPEGADVFSYPEDDMVKDSKLAEHLQHFGIDIMKMNKTEQTVEEMTIDNFKQSREQIAIMETDSSLEKLTGKWLTGIYNTGNSCYINSTVQVLLRIPSVMKYYVEKYDELIKSYSIEEDVKSFRVQFSKLGHCLKSGEYSFPEDVENKIPGDVLKPHPGLTPQMFRNIIGMNHPEFSTKQQQDVNEFLIHLFNTMKKDIKQHNDANDCNPLHSVAFKIEDRIFCETTKTVNYQSHEEFILSLNIPLEETINKEEVDKYEQISNDGENKFIDKEPIRPKIKLTACIQSFMSSTKIDGYMASNGATGNAFHSSKLETFPDYLWIQLKRFTVGADWKPKKLDVEILVPDTLDLGSLKAKGIQSDETPMADEPSKPAVELNQDLVANCLAMGFPENACKKAVYLTGNSSLEQAIEWLMINVGESDFDVLPDELKPNASVSGGNITEFNSSDIDTMCSLGFTPVQTKRALSEVQGNLERAVDWAFNHPDEMNAMVSDIASSKVESTPFVYSDGQPHYELVAMISHMGNNCHVGHYVAHIKQENDTWVLYNDEKVQRSVNPPKQFAYMYLYKRIDAGM